MTRWRVFPLGLVALIAAVAAPAFAADQRVPAMTVQIGSLFGLTEAQLRDRLQILPAPHAYLTRIEVKDGVETRLLDAADLRRPGGRCAPRSLVLPAVTDGATREGYPRFIFKGGRLVEVRRGFEEVVIAPDARLEIYCTARPGIGPGDLVQVGLTAPLIALVAVQRAPERLARAAGIQALRDLRLGQAPLRGLAAYRARPPRFVTVGEVDGGDVLITVSLGESRVSKEEALVRVTVREGRIVAITRDRGNFNTCALTPAGSMDCGLPG